MNKTTIAVIIMIALMAIPVIAIPTKAQPGTSLKTYPLIDAVPNPVGVGEQVLIRFGILQQLGDVTLGWKGVTVTVLKPDGTTETLGPFTTDSTGSSITIYTPTQVGTYTLTTHFPEQPVPATYFNFEGGNMFFEGTTMLASSISMNLTVQAEPLPDYPGHALPAEYWSRPIDAQLREWASIAGNWVTRPDNSLADDNQAPETAHVLWAKQLTTGGLIGDYWGDGQVPAGAESGDAYEGKFQNSVILNGILYYNVAPPTGVYSSSLDVTGIKAVDLHTGQELWFKNNTSLSFGQILYWNSYNVDGVYTYIISDDGGGTWNAYDPFNGEWEWTFVNVPSGAATVRGPSGEILIYQIDYTSKWMALWNSTLCGIQTGVRGTPDMGSWASNAHMKVLDASSQMCYSWNVSIPAGLTSSTSFFAPILKVYPDRVMSVAFNLTQARLWALSTVSGQRGQLLFDRTWQAPAEWLAGQNTIQYTGATDYVKGGVFALWDKELRTHYGFSTETGAYLWQTESEAWQDAYGWGNAEHTWYFAYGYMYSVGIGGIVYAYDLKTGKAAWTYTMSDAYNEPVTGDNWWGWIDLISDGKVYVGTLEHSAEQPIPRGGPYICLNATTGDVIWRVNGMFRETRWGGNGIIGDSIIATMDTYDQRIYAIGKGPSALTVTAPDSGVTVGSKMVIKGTVKDISSGTQDYALAARFPNGVPVVSDDSMSSWMLYVYKQFERPANATGVPISIDVLDSNGNYRNIGTATSDSTGKFTFTWAPDIPGDFTVIATFHGSKAYYPSYDETFFTANTAAPTAPPVATAAPSMADLYFVPSVVAIIIVIIVVGAVLALLMLRKRP
jgi:hypothetical protein